MKKKQTGILLLALLALAALTLAVLGPMMVHEEGARHGPAAATKDAPIHARGVVESDEEAVVGSQAAGIIRKMEVAEGDPVTRGQLIAVLESAKIAAKIDQAEAAKRESQARLQELLAGNRPEDREMAKNRLSRAETVFGQARDEFERQERLLKKEATTRVERNRAEERMRVTEEELNEARASLQKTARGSRQEEIEQARARVGQAEADVAYYRSLMGENHIISPINGIVVERIKREGESVDVGTPVAKLINPEKMRIRAEMEETDVGKIGEGTAVEVMCDSFPGKVYRGKVSRVFPFVQRREQKTFDPVASFDINTQKIHIALDDFSGLKNGMSVTVKFLK